MRVIAVGVAAALFFGCTVISDRPAEVPFVPDSIQIVTLSGGQQPSIPGLDTVSVGDTLTIYAKPYKEGSLFIDQVNWIVGDTGVVNVITIAPYNTMEMTFKASRNVTITALISNVKGVDSIHVK